MHHPLVVCSLTKVHCPQLDSINLHFIELQVYLQVHLCVYFNVSVAINKLHLCNKMCNI